MTYQEAMALLKTLPGYHPMIRRARWEPYQAVILFPDIDQETGRYLGMGRVYDSGWTFDCPMHPELFELDNACGNTSGGSIGSIPYDPTPDDLAATDWEVYDAGKLFPEEASA